jgi:hypothetical protein
MMLAAAVVYTFWVQPCAEAPKSGCVAADEELAVWALGAWEEASQGRLRFTRESDERKAQLRFYWTPAHLSLYGEARPIEVGGRRGAEIHVRPEIAGPEGRRDILWRDTIVYLTCLHESGHALGLPHTDRFDDIMYSFAFGGDIREYFARYRRALKSRDGIRRQPGMSPADVAALRALFR